MKITLQAAPLHGQLRAIPSKSYVHRALICASLADAPTEILCTDTNRDMDATVNCLQALGARITKTEDRYTVLPLTQNAVADRLATLDCGESGSTLRFLLPVAAALGQPSRFLAHGRLSERPLSPLFEELQAHGVTLSAQGQFPLELSGKLTSGMFRLSGSVSSQFFTGLMLALPLLQGDSRIESIGKTESAPYLALTEAVLRSFGVQLRHEGDGSQLQLAVSSQTFRSPGTLCSEGDWSNAAFWLVAGAIGGDVTLTGLQVDSCQGDRAIVSLLREMGASVTECGEGVLHAVRSPLHGITIDATDIPDLVPILAVAAAAATGETRIVGAARLRLKESDRLQSVCAMLRALGGDCEETADGLLIRGGRQLVGGEVDSCNDHRIAMSAAVASCLCNGQVNIQTAQAVEKSYPAFFADFAKLGGRVI